MCKCDRRLCGTYEVEGEVYRVPPNGWACSISEKCRCCDKTIKKFVRQIVK